MHGAIPVLTTPSWRGVYHEQGQVYLYISLIFYVKPFAFLTMSKWEKIKTFRRNYKKKKKAE
jgi:hypothetical protein